jgi:hypothetical protein
MWRAFGMCAGIAFTVACGLSNEYVGPSGGGIGGNGPGGGNGSSAASSTVGLSGGQTGSTGGNGGNGVNGVNGVGTTNGFGGTSNGGGPGGNGPGGNGPGGNGPGGGVGASTGRFMGTNGGTIGGGGTTGGGGGACSSELEPCDPADGGPSCCDNEKLTCTTEPSAGSSFCEKTCKRASDCDNAQTVCSTGTCVLNVCGGSSANGSYDGICSSGNLNGTCVPEGSGMSEYGICHAGGTTDAGCSETAPKSDPGDLCIAGEACGPNPDGPNEICFTLCLPGFGNGGNAFCLGAGFTGGCFEIGSGDLGVCYSL